MKDSCICRCRSLFLCLPLLLGIINSIIVMNIRFNKCLLLAGVFCILMMLPGCMKVETPVFTGKFEDLGLSVKWGEANLGATYREDLGNYFAWGETASKEKFNSSNYKWMKDGLLTKYCTSQHLGNVDGKSSLDIEDDAACKQLGTGWRMPTLAEFQELYEKCTWVWSDLGGVRGFMIISNVPGYEDRYIFLPAAGYNPQDEVMSDNYYCYYWISEIDNDDNTPSARIWRASAMNAGAGLSPRYYGIPIRPVHD